ncbi:MAG: YafY family protein [Verrucomicrobia bacterium]|nr:YafY family protein [Verrucomicrobiota bacterium]
MNRTDRLVAMVMHLQGRRIVRAEELAAHFEVNVRTIYRDISALGEAGVPIAGEAGVGYSLVKGYHLPPVSLTADEATALFVGGAMVKQFTDASLHEPMAAALDKLRAVLPRERQDHVERLGRQTVVLGRPRGMAPEPDAQPWLLAVQRGVGQRRVLRMTYRGREKDETARDVEPLGVVCYGGAWYLVAWCRLREDVRHFRVDRIRELVVLDELFPAHEDFSLTKHLKEQVSRDDVLPVRVWFAKCVQDRARRETYATLVAERERDGGTEFAFTTYAFEWLARWLLSFGAEAEALEPAKLRRLVGQEAKRVINRYARSVRKRS